MASSRPCRSARTRGPSITGSSFVLAEQVAAGEPPDRRLVGVEQPLHGRGGHGLIILVDAFGTFEREGWSEGRAAPYHHGLGAITSRPVEALLDAARVGAGSSVLDVATGPGYAAGRAAARGASVVGVDFSEEMLSLAASLHPSVSFQRADAGSLPFSDGSFDAVVASFLMPHVADLPAVTAELARVVQPGGRLALVTWDPEPETFTRALFEAIAESGATPPPGLPPGPPFFQYAASDEFTVLLRGAGLVEVSVQALAFTHRIDDLDAFWTDLVGGTVRASVLIRAQPAELQARIRRLYGEKLERWRVRRRLGARLRGQDRRRDTKLTHPRVDPSHDPPPRSAPCPPIVDFVDLRPTKSTTGRI